MLAGGRSSSCQYDTTVNKTLQIPALIMDIGILLQYKRIWYQKICTLSAVAPHMKKVYKQAVAGGVVCNGDEVSMALSFYMKSKEKLQEFHFFSYVP